MKRSSSQASVLVRLHPWLAHPAVCGYGAGEPRPREEMELGAQSPQSLEKAGGGRGQRPAQASLSPAGTRSAMRTTPLTSSSTCTLRRGRASSTAGRTCWATCSRCGHREPPRSSQSPSGLPPAGGCRGRPSTGLQALQSQNHKSALEWPERFCGSSSLFRAEFLYLGTLAILSWKIFCGCFACCRMAQQPPGLYSVDALTSSVPSPLV